MMENGICRRGGKKGEHRGKPQFVLFSSAQGKAARQNDVMTIARLFFTLFYSTVLDQTNESLVHGFGSGCSIRLFT